ncbi:hypothetical protein [Halomonas sp.]|uniref:hypothetical protein n=1 Tax=Halomonas sp. TaxID=1486246 RepID=UPI0025C2921A|nr:hypothetical protein [Halomonas sp.]
MLPCFMASAAETLVNVLEEEVAIDRQFWITARQEQRRLARVRLLWDFLREALEVNRAFLMGESRELRVTARVSRAAAGGTPRARRWRPSPRR